MTWTIYPLDMGTAQLPETTLINGPDRSAERRIASPSIAWLLVEDAKPEYILVDAGPCDDYEWGVRYHNGFLRNNQQNITAQLSMYGLIPEQISRVILTHLHWDHAYGVLELPKAEVILQRREWHYALDPLPQEAILYETSIQSQLPFFLHFFHRLQLVDGDTELCPGLRLVALPGHSPGSQGVLVETKRGRYVIAGDLIGAKETWQQRIFGEIMHNKQEGLASLAKIASLEAEVLPSHDYYAWEMLAVKRNCD